MANAQIAALQRANVAQQVQINTLLDALTAIGGDGGTPAPVSARRISEIGDNGYTVNDAEANWTIVAAPTQPRPILLKATDVVYFATGNSVKIRNGGSAAMPITPDVGVQVFPLGVRSLAPGDTAEFECQGRNKFWVEMPKRSQLQLGAPVSDNIAPIVSLVGSLFTLVHAGLWNGDIATYTAQWVRAGADITAVTGVTSTDTFTKTAHGLVNGDFVTIAALTGGSGLALGTPYFVVGAAANTFQLSLTPGGTAVDLVTNVTAATVNKWTDLTNDTAITRAKIGADDGTTIACKVRAVDKLNRPASLFALSNGIAVPGAGALPANTRAPSWKMLDGTVPPASVPVGTVLVADMGDWTGAPTLVPHVYNPPAGGGAPADRGVLTSPFQYTTQTGDQNETVYFTTTATNVNGSPPPLTSAPLSVVPAGSGAPGTGSATLKAALEYDVYGAGGSLGVVSEARPDGVPTSYDWSNYPR